MLDPKKCQNGTEQYERFQTPAGNTRVQYDYRAADGKLFSCIALTLEHARQKRDTWLKERSNEPSIN